MGAVTSATLLVSDKAIMKITGMSVDAGAIAAAVATGRTDSILSLALRGDDVILGSSGNDSLIGLTGNDTISGKNGSDQLLGLEGDDVLDGGAGNDILIGGAGRNILYGGQGIDVALYYGETPVTVSLALTGYQNTGVSRDRLTGIEAIAGGKGNDRLTGNDSANLLAGGDGNDVLTGAAGNDTLFGNDGRDTITGGTGNDEIEGGAGGDRLGGGGGKDALRGDAGHDYLTGGAGADTLIGGAGNDTLVGGAGDDQLFGGEGIDTVIFQGDDAFYVDLGSQFLVQTGQGLDRFDGIENATTGAGNDLLHGSEAANRLTGGAGRDTFAFHFASDSAAGRGRDVITDFAPGLDRLNLSQIDANPDQTGEQAFLWSDRATAFGLWTVKSGADLLIRADMAIQLAHLDQIGAGDLIL